MKPLKLSCMLILLVLGSSISSTSQAEHLKESQNSAPSIRALSNTDKPQPTTKQKEVRSDERGTEKSPLVVTIAPGPQAQEKVADAEREKERKSAAEDRAEITTWIVALATAIQAVALFLTIGVMRRTAQQQLRAYLHLEADKKLLADTDSGLEVRLELKNVGKTPVFKLNHWMLVDVKTYPFQGEFPHNDFDTANTYLPPSTVMTLACQWNTPWRQIHLETDDGTDTRLYIWGQVSYVDAFNIPRHLNFRFTRRRGCDHLEYCNEGNGAN